MDNSTNNNQNQLEPIENQERVSNNLSQNTIRNDHENLARLNSGMSRNKQFKTDLNHSKNGLGNLPNTNSNFQKNNGNQSTVNNKNESKNGSAKDKLKNNLASKGMQAAGVPAPIAKKMSNSKRMQNVMSKVGKMRHPLLSLGKGLLGSGDDKNESKLKGQDDNKFDGVSIKIPPVVIKWIVIAGVPAFCVIIFICLFSTASQTYVNISGIAEADNVEDSELDKDDKWHESGDGSTEVDEVEETKGKKNTYKVVLLKKKAQEVTLDQLNDLFGDSIKCEKKNCSNTPEFKFYVKMYDIYNRYKDKYGIKLDLQLLMATLSIGEDQIANVFKKNLNSYDRNQLEDTDSTLDLDWEYDYKIIPGYLYLSKNDSRYDMQVLAKGMVIKTTKGTCNGKAVTVKNVDDSRLSSEGCKDGSEFKQSGQSTYKIAEKDEYKQFLKEFFEYKFFISESEKIDLYKKLGYNTNIDQIDSEVSTSKSNSLADAMVKLALNEYKANKNIPGGEKYLKPLGFGYGTPWCAAFVTYVADNTKYNGKNVTSIVNVRSGAVTAFANYFLGNHGKNVKFHYNTSCSYYKNHAKYTPRPGDYIIFTNGYLNCNGTTGYLPDGCNSHIGIVEKSANGKVFTIEGNTGDGYGWLANKSYELSSCRIVGYGSWY